MPGKELAFYFKFCFDSGFKGRDAVPQMVKAYMDKKLMLDEFITHHMTLDQINYAIELMKQSKWYIHIPIQPPFRIYEQEYMPIFFFAPQYPDGAECCSRIRPL